jgi:hypothetical protein
MSPERIGGLIEVPALAACLTLNKGDFIRTGARGANYLVFRKAIQEAVSRQLATWGDARASTDDAPPREVRPLQRDLAHVLEELALDFPLLASLVEQRSGGQKRLPLGQASSASESRAFVAASIAEHSEAFPDERKSPSSSPQSQNSDKTRNGSSATESAVAPSHGLLLPAQSAVLRPGHYGLDIQFEDQPEALELAHLMQSTVWVNRAHPAYRRALASRSVGYHIALAVAMALAPLAVESANEHAFVTAFLFRWGEAIENSTPRKQRNMRGNARRPASTKR